MKQYRVELVGYRSPISQSSIVSADREARAMVIALARVNAERGERDGVFWHPSSIAKLSASELASIRLAHKRNVKRWAKNKSKGGDGNAGSIR